MHEAASQQEKRRTECSSDPYEVSYDAVSDDIIQSPYKGRGYSRVIGVEIVPYEYVHSHTQTHT